MIRRKCYKICEKMRKERKKITIKLCKQRRQNTGMARGKEKVLSGRRLKRVTTNAPAVHDTKYGSKRRQPLDIFYVLWLVELRLN